MKKKINQIERILATRVCVSECSPLQNISPPLTFPTQQEKNTTKSSEVIA